MKKLYSLFICASFIIVAHAQITSAEMAAIGDTVIYQSINKNGFDTYAATSGVGVEWNYISIIEKIDSVELDYIDPATCSEAASFPDATVAEAINGANGHFFYELGTGEYYRDGFYDAANNLSIPYDNKLKLYQLPFQFGTSFSDSYTCANGTFDVYPAIIDDGIYDSDVDGSGVLRLPQGYFDNVYRIYYEESFTIKADLGMGTYMGIVQIEEYGYEYWKAGHVKPLLTYYNTTTTDLIQGGSSNDVGVRYDKHANPDGINPGINENTLLTSIDIFPNPSIGIIHVNAKDLTEITSLEIYDVVGKMIFAKELQNGDNMIEQTDLAKGVYYIKVSSGTSVKTEKLILN
jgi:hypothetical protein